MRKIVAKAQAHFLEEGKQRLCFQMDGCKSLNHSTVRALLGLSGLGGAALW